MSCEPHSAAYFNDQRDFWFNADWLALLARRLGLTDVHRALDVGSGQGHWTFLVEPLLAPGATICGIEREPEWVHRASGRAQQRGLAERVSFQEGVAEQLPFADATFELVTCQTVLIHLPDAAAAVAEMVRVTRPGGIVLASEPNNAAGMLVSTTADHDEPIAQRLERLGFLLTCQHGKAVLGEGDGGVADLLPGHFARAGLVEIRTFVNDRTDLLIGPYADDAQQALREAMISGSGDDHWIGWSRAQARRLFVAGGGDEQDFDGLWDRRVSEARRDAQALREARLTTAGGRIHYLIAGRVPQ
ncbi:MAG: class I SAM-dependent methyltransferase [Solirubrobacteraceae bacterium]